MAATIALMAVLLAPAGDRRLLLPDFGGGDNLGVPIALYAPLFVAVVLVAGLAGGDPRLEAIAVRPLPTFDALYGGAVAALTLLACSAVWLGGLNVYALEAGRNATGYIGLALIGRRLLGPRVGGLVPVAVVIAVSITGLRPDGSARRWAWPLAPGSDDLSWLAAFGLLAVGLVLTAFVNRSALEPD